MEPIPLSDQDVAILELEGPTVAGHTCKVIRLGAESSLDQLRARVAARLDAAPMLSRRLGRAQGRPAWVATR